MHYSCSFCRVNFSQAKEFIIIGRLKSTLRADMAVEFDFARKRDECLGQALRYSTYTKKPAACCLIIEKKKDYKYYYQLKHTIQNKELDVKLFTITPSTLIRAGILSDEIQ